MSQQNFVGGFITGALVGGVLGGVVGVLASNRWRDRTTDDFTQLSEEERRRLENATPDERMEIARRGLEDKIAQLNTAIEDVRIQMGSVNHPRPAHDFAEHEN
ncbi:MAG: gas vesicle protein [Phormidesmis priestleyi]|uniref:Gas vesicle protein n=1 Tax=Phormidesmis priestleyi TaxID=268141 RepID=A0A2W4XTK2_9CYAN|nr:MAG: gas vesicle protein [Phormidesmis priestleyi]